jgi:hypothetical protein
MARRATPLTYFPKSGRGGGPHVGRDWKTAVSFILHPPNGRLTPTVPEGGGLFKMALSRPKYPLPDNPELRSVTERCPCETAGSTLRTVVSRTLVTMRNVSPFYTRKGLDSTARKLTNASRLKKRTLHVEARNETPAAVPLKATLLGSHAVHVARHTSLNCSRGVLHSDSPDGTSDEEIPSVC